MAIQTNQPLTKKESQVYKRFKALSVNEEPLPQGDGTIRISPFDDYVIFTLFDEKDNENTPIDLSNVGTIFLVFVGANDEIRIPNYTKVLDVDLAGGQVMFKIDKDNSKKILALDNKNFYVSAVMIDPDGESDESVLYTGTFLSYTDSAKKSMTAQQEELTIQYSKEIAALQTTNQSLNERIAELETALEEANVTITALRTSNEELSNEVATLNEELGSTEAELKLQAAKLAQKNAEANAKKQQQILSIKQKAKQAATNAKRKQYYQQAAANMQQFSLGATPVTNTSSNSTVTGGTGLSQSSGSGYNAGGSGGFIDIQ